MAENNIYIYISLRSHYYFPASSNGNLTLNCQLPSQINNCDSLTSTEEPTTMTEEPTTTTEEPTTMTEEPTTTTEEPTTMTEEPTTTTEQTTTTGNQTSSIVQLPTDKSSTNSKLNIVHLIAHIDIQSHII